MATYVESQRIRRDFTKRLDDLEAGATYRMLVEYQRMARGLERQITDAITDRTPLGDAIAASFAGAEDTYRVALLRGRLGFIVNEMQRFGVTADEIMTETLPTAYRAGLTSVEQTLDAISTSFTRPNRLRVEQSIALFLNGTNTQEYFARFAVESAEQVTNTILNGVITGQGSKVIARNLRGQLNLPQHRIRTAARTEIRRAALEAQHQMMLANRTIIKGWRWNAALDRTTCAVCWAMNDSFHPVDEILSSHPNCRCSMAIVTKTFDEMRAEQGLEPSGIDPLVRPSVDPNEALKALPAADQIRILGPTKASLFRDGKITLQDLVRPTYSDRWGPGLREATLRELEQAGITMPSTIDRVAAGRAARETPSAPAPPPAASTDVPEWRAQITDITAEFRGYDLPNTVTDWARADEEWILPSGAPGASSEAAERVVIQAGEVLDAEIERRMVERFGEDVIRAAAQYDEVSRDLMNVVNQMRVAGDEMMKASRAYYRNQIPRNQTRMNKADAAYRDLEARRDELLAEAKRIEVDVERVRRWQQQTTRDVLAELRDWGGGTIRTRGEVTDQIAEAIRHAEGSFPTDWVERLPDTGYNFRRTQRGYYNGHTIGLSDHSSSGMLDVATHEVGHAMEDTIPGLRAMEWVFYYRRTDAANVKARNVAGYSKREWFREDEFGDFYIGRDYRREMGARYATMPYDNIEVFTMGVESLIGERRRDIVWRDADHRRFILGVLAIL